MPKSAVESKSRKVDYAKADINASLPAEDKLRLLKDMIRIRHFEQVS